MWLVDVWVDQGAGLDVAQRPRQDVLEEGCWDASVHRRRQEQDLEGLFSENSRKSVALDTNYIEADKNTHELGFTTPPNTDELYDDKSESFTNEEQHEISLAKRAKCKHVDLVDGKYRGN